MAMDYSKYSLSEVSTFLKIWGTGFKSLNVNEYPYAIAYYQACLDAYFFINNQRMRFFNLGGLKRTLLLLADDFMVEFTSKREGEEYKHRAELCQYIANNLLVSKDNAVQIQLFEQ